MGTNPTSDERRRGIRFRRSLTTVQWLQWESVGVIRNEKVCNDTDREGYIWVKLKRGEEKIGIK